MSDELDSSCTVIGENANKPPCSGLKRKQKHIRRHSRKPYVRAQRRHPCNSPFQCSTIRMRDVEQLNAALYSHPTTINLDNWIVKFIQVKQKKDRSPKT
ncbi:hypothetical protein PoB_003992400 [Plakobranchus ocellatus]|uniref:Uncharacterized protein n=1 Tax=Plakobranchus ocellatus TaxID=259542 RepID=A0AAV4B420_9GAST|nr:hypothetical protein PoB_003992400 [Plakobranchus ocellatus]